MLSGQRTIKMGCPKLTEIQQDILHLLWINGPMPRKDLVVLTGKPRTTVYDNLMKLKNAGLIYKSIVPRNTRGRPMVIWGAVNDIEIKF